MKIITDSSEQTIEEGKKFALSLKPNDVIAFSGTLGAGKTVFTKGIALGLGIEENITSPTFTIIQEYSGRLPLFHMDLYRLESVEDFEMIGGEDYFFRGGVTVLEWSEKAASILPRNHYKINIDVIEEAKRKITIEKNGEKIE